MDSHEENDDVKIYEEKNFKNGHTPQKDSRQRWKNASFIASLEFALSGIIAAVREERNMRKHLIVAAVVIILGIFLRVSELDWLILLMSIFFVIAAELMNSAVENVVDLAADYKFYMRAKRAKDMAAGSVLVISFFTAIAGCVIFIPRIWRLFFH